MSAQQRRRAFALALVATATTLAGVALSAASDQAGGEEVTRGRQQPNKPTLLGSAPPEHELPGVAVQGPASEDLAFGREPHSAAPRAPGVAGRTARRFLAALLLFEVEGASGQITRELRASASPRLVRFLLAREPRQPLASDPPSPGRLVGLELAPTRTQDRLQFTATIARGHRTSGLIVSLHRHGGRWWVSDLG